MKTPMGAPFKSKRCQDLTGSNETIPIPYPASPSALSFVTIIKSSLFGLRHFSSGLPNKDGAKAHCAAPITVAMLPT